MFRLVLKNLLPREQHLPSPIQVHQQVHPDFSPDSIGKSAVPVRNFAGLVGSDRLNYSVRVEPKENWNLLLGGSWEINKRWSLTAEVGGIMDRFQAIGALMWRF